MPGMMDTVLNLGLNDATVQGLAKSSGDERFAWDSYRRFIQMYSDVVLDVDHRYVRGGARASEGRSRRPLDTELTADDWRRWSREYKKIVESAPASRSRRIRTSSSGARSARCSARWMNERANVYRRLNDIPESWGTAVNVQAMVFGNMGDDCATGVAFTRDPSTGENRSTANS